jgi:hypothetical protein
MHFISFEILTIFIAVICNMKGTSPLSTNKILQLLTKHLSDFYNDKSSKGEDIMEAREETQALRKKSVLKMALKRK